MKNQIPKDYIGRLGPDHPGVAVFAFDFDGTLCKNAYPKIGEPDMEMINYAKALKEQGHKIILNTCRENDMPEGATLLTDAIVWCRHYDLEFDTTNDNLPELIEKYGGDCRKISADFPVDRDAICEVPPDEEDNALPDLIKKVCLSRAEHIEAMTAAYCAKTATHPRDVVLVEQHVDNKTTFYYAKRADFSIESDPPVDAEIDEVEPMEEALKEPKAKRCYAEDSDDGICVEGTGRADECDICKHEGKSWRECFFGAEFMGIDPRSLQNQEEKKPDSLNNETILDEAADADDENPGWDLAGYLVLEEVSKRLSPGQKISGEDTAILINAVCLDLCNMLIHKNQKYGNSALQPVRVFSTADTREQLYVRMDDKLSRIKEQRCAERIEASDEDNR